MSHLHLAAAATQHAAQWHASAAEVNGLRDIGYLFGVVCVIGLIRSIAVWGRSRGGNAVSAEQPARAEELRDAA